MVDDISGGAQAGGTTPQIDVGPPISIKSSPSRELAPAKASAILRRRRATIFGFFAFLGLLMSTVAESSSPRNTLPLTQNIFFYIALIGAGICGVLCLALPDAPSIPGPQVSPKQYVRLQAVPFYRIEPGSIVMLLALLLPPVTWVLCLIVLSGPVYKKPALAQGRFETWGLSNRIVAVVLPFAQIALFYFAYSQLA